MGNNPQPQKSSSGTGAESALTTKESISDGKLNISQTNATPYLAQSENSLSFENVSKITMDNNEHGKTQQSGSSFSAFSDFRARIDPKNMDPDTKEKVKAGLFLGTLTGLSMLSGFGMTLAVAKRQDPNNFAKGLTGSKEIPESGISLASRALARGTMCSILGVGLLSFAVWKILGVHNLTEFRYKVGSMMPVIPKSENPGRGDFRTIRDLFQFIIDEDEKEKQEKMANSNVKENKPS